MYKNTECEIVKRARRSRTGRLLRPPHHQGAGIEAENPPPSPPTLEHDDEVMVELSECEEPVDEGDEVFLGVLKCGGCNKSFMHQGALSTHQIHCKRYNMRTCSDCGVRCKNPAALAAHSKVHLPIGRRAHHRGVKANPHQELASLERDQQAPGFGYWYTSRGHHEQEPPTVAQSKSITPPPTATAQK